MPMPPAGNQVSSAPAQNCTHHKELAEHHHRRAYAIATTTKCSWFKPPVLAEVHAQSPGHTASVDQQAHHRLRLPETHNTVGAANVFCGTPTKQNLHHLGVLGLCAWSPACCYIPSRARNDCCARWRWLCCALPGRTLLLVQLSLLLLCMVQHSPCRLHVLLLPLPVLLLVPLVILVLRVPPAAVFLLLLGKLLVTCATPLSSSSAHHELNNLAGVLILCQDLVKQAHCFADRRVLTIGAKPQHRVGAHAVECGSDQGLLQELHGFFLC